MLNPLLEIVSLWFMKRIQFTLHSHSSLIRSKVVPIEYCGLMVDRGYELEFLNPKKNASATLTKYEERLYDHIVLFPQKLKGFSLSCRCEISGMLWTGVNGSAGVEFDTSDSSPISQ